MLSLATRRLPRLLTERPCWRRGCTKLAVSIGRVFQGDWLLGVEPKIPIEIIAQTQRIKCKLRQTAQSDSSKIMGSDIDHHCYENHHSNGHSSSFSKDQGSKAGLLSGRAPKGPRRLRRCGAPCAFCFVLSFCSVLFVLLWGAVCIVYAGMLGMECCVFSAL